MIDVAFSRPEIRPARVAIVIDVLRATSTATEALAAGYRRVLCAESIERARSLRGEERVLAGERHCVMPDGFDQGNSPREAAVRRGEDLILATTNGAPAIVAAAAVSDQVILGCLLNLSAVLTALRGREDWTRLDLQLICSGTDGAPALEDAYVAGLISAVLPGPRSDAALICEAVARAYPTPVEALAASADAAILRGARLEADIAHCATVSRLDCVPTVVGTQVGVAIVAAGADGLAPALGASDRGTVSA